MNNEIIIDESYLETIEKKLAKEKKYNEKLNCFIKELKEEIKQLKAKIKESER